MEKKLENTIPKVKKRRKRRISRKTELRIKVSLFVVCMALIGIFVLVFNSGERFPLREMTNVTLTGYEGKGRIEVELEAQGEWASLPEAVEFLDSVTIEVCGTTGAVNGEFCNEDLVEIQYTYDKKLAKSLGLRVDGKEKSLKVTNLPVPTIITNEELFSDVEFTYEGLSPIITAEIKNNSTHEFLKNVVYEIVSPQKFYEKGDVVEVKAVFNENEALIMNYVVEPGEKGYIYQYTIDSVDSYLTDADKITEEMLNTMIAEGTTLLGDANEYGLRIFSEAGCMPIWINNETTFEWKNPYFISAYFDTATEEYMGEVGTFVNAVKIVYGVTLTQANGVSCQAEVVVRFSDLTENTDGTIDLALESGDLISASHEDKHIKSIVQNKYASENYYTERLD